MLNEDGTIGHSEVTIGDSTIMAFDAHPDWPDTPSFLSVYVGDVDESWRAPWPPWAVVITEVTTSRIVGDRARPHADPVGNIWWIQTYLEDVDEATMHELFADPGEAATMQRLQESFAVEMRRRAGR